MPSTAAMGTLADEASKLLDFNQKLDINLLDSIVTCMYTGDGQRVCVYRKHQENLETRKMCFN